MDLIREGAHGEDVRDVQHRLLGVGLRVEPDELDGTFGASTLEAVREFQRRRGLPDDGIVGSDTWNQLVEAGYRVGDRTLYLRSPAFRGDDVRDLQRMLNAIGFDAGKEDGIFGSRVAGAVREFQRNWGAKSDGIVGLDTVRALQGVRPASDGPGRSAVREDEAARRMARSLTGSLIAIDPGHGPDDVGVEAHDLVEAEVTFAISDALADEIARRGGRSVTLRQRDEDPDVSLRAQRANAADADVCVSLHLGGGGIVTSGAVCCYFGTPQTHTPMGARLAEALRAALVDAGWETNVRPLTIAILRETRMPAVQCELAVIENEDEAARVAAPAFASSIAAVLADGVEAFLGARSANDAIAGAARR
jgi:N-acetylmuramoyl-L-alanine amidase